MDYNVNSNSQNPQQSPLPPKNYYSKKNLWKWILLYVVIAAVAYGAVYYFFFYNKNGGYVAQDQTQVRDEMADWKTYTSSEYGWEIKYPTAWKVQDRSFTYNGVKSISLNVTSPVRYDLPGYEIGVMYLLQIGASNENKPVVSHQGFVKVRTPGQQAVEDITLPDNFLKSSEEYKQVQEIISTLKFTGSAAADWKTYTNNDYGFEFKYPQKFDTTFADFNPLPTALVNPAGSSNINSAGCFVLNDGSHNSYQTSQVTINNTNFCLSQTGDPGAGQLYREYNYTTVPGTGSGTLAITLQYTVHTANGCGAYMGTPNYQSCVDFENNYNDIVMKPIQDSVATLKFTK